MLALPAAAALLATAIYPDGHWDRVAKPTESSFASLVESTVDEGKTLFVRWIASEG